MAAESHELRPGNPALADNPADYWVDGTITSVQGQELLVNDQHGIVTRVLITDKTRFWRGRVGAPLSQVKPGDFLCARGALEGNVLTGGQVWVNIVSISGVITRVENGRLSVDTGQEELRVEIQPETEHFVSGTLRSHSNVRMARGTPVQVIGLWEQSSQQVRATRLFLPPE